MNDPHYRVVLINGRDGVFMLFHQKVAVCNTAHEVMAQLREKNWHTLLQDPTQSHDIKKTLAVSLKMNILSKHTLAPYLLSQSIIMISFGYCFTSIEIYEIVKNPL